MPRLYFQLFLFIYVHGQSREDHPNFNSIFIKHFFKCKYSALNNRSAITLNNGTLILHKKINNLVRKYYFSYYSVKHPNICPAITETPTPIDDVASDVTRTPHHWSHCSNGSQQRTDWFEYQCQTQYYNITCSIPHKNDNVTLNCNI